MGPRRFTSCMMECLLRELGCEKHLYPSHPSLKPGPGSDLQRQPQRPVWGGGVPSRVELGETWYRWTQAARALGNIDLLLCFLGCHTPLLQHASLSLFLSVSLFPLADEVRAAAAAEAGLPDEQRGYGAAGASPLWVQGSTDRGSQVSPDARAEGSP